MHGRKDIFRHNTLTDNDSIFEVISAPWHKRYQDISTKRKFSALSRATINQHFVFLETLTFPDNWFLIDAGILICTEEFCELIFYPTFVVETDNGLSTVLVNII